MAFSRESLLDGILERYSAWYNTERCAPVDAPLVAKAEFHEHETGYMLVRQAEMWSADRHEYTYFFSVPTLTKELYEQCIGIVRTQGEPLVKPDSGHMSTVLAAVFLCDSVTDEAAKAVKQCRIRKSFHFSLRGWMEVHTAAVDLGKATVIGNSVARNTVKFLKSMLHPKQKLNLLKIVRS